MIKKPKQRKNIAMEAFPEQFKSLRPEASGQGVKSRSQSEAIRMAVYKEINKLFSECHPYCECCDSIWPGLHGLHFREDTHHCKGRDGLLLFDVRWFKSTCRKAHVWIGNHPKKAYELGFLLPGWGQEKE